MDKEHIAELGKKEIANTEVIEEMKQEIKKLS
jgi:hypothetical protein